MGLKDRFKIFPPEIVKTAEEDFIPAELKSVAVIPDYGRSIEDCQPVEAAIIDDLSQYINDPVVSKIVVAGDVAAIYRGENLSEKITLLNPELSFIKKDKTVFRYTDGNLIISGILPPAAAKQCITIEKIQVLTPVELINKNIISKARYEFIQKGVQARKNFIFADSTALINTLVNGLPKNSFTIIQDLELIKSDNSNMNFNVTNLSEKEFKTLMDIALDIESDYLICNIADENKTSKVLCAGAERSGKIFGIDTVNAQAALLQVINMIMTTMHCNEKIAKSKLLHSFNYIVDKSGIYVITPAKTSIITLKAVPV